MQLVTLAAQFEAETGAKLARVHVMLRNRIPQRPGDARDRRPSSIALASPSADASLALAGWTRAQALGQLLKPWLSRLDHSDFVSPIPPRWQRVGWPATAARSRVALRTIESTRLFGHQETRARHDELRAGSY